MKVTQAVRTVVRHRKLQGEEMLALLTKNKLLEGVQGSLQVHLTR